MGEKIIDYGVCCLWCNKEHNVRVPLSGLIKWESGSLIQDALPTLSAGDRELLISNTCESCFQKMCEEHKD